MHHPNLMWNNSEEAPTALSALHIIEKEHPDVFVLFFLCLCMCLFSSPHGLPNSIIDINSTACGNSCGNLICSYSRATDCRCCSKNKADLGLLPGGQDDSVGQKVLFFALGLIPVVAKREMSDWLSSNHTLLWGAFKISGRNVQIAVYWQRSWCFMFSVVIRMYLCETEREFTSHIWHACMKDFFGLICAHWSKTFVFFFFYSKLMSFDFCGFSIAYIATCLLLYILI